VTAIVQIWGKTYNILCAEADARNVTVPALARAVLSKIADGELDDILKGIDLSEHGKPPYRKKSYGQKRKNFSFEFKGTRYSTLAELSLAVGIPLSTIYMRMKRGMSLENAVTVPPQNRTKEFPEICRLHNMEPGVVRERLKLGWDFERALTTPVRAGAK
jgi:hypothetical protein